MRVSKKITYPLPTTWLTNMKEYPILFQTEMVQAICKGEKTESRRLAGLQPVNQNPDEWELAHTGELSLHSLKKEEAGCLFAGFVNKNDVGNRLAFKCPYGIHGGLLYVRERWANISPFSPGTNGIIYYASQSDLALEIDQLNGVKWKPSIHLKKEHSRLWLNVEEIKVERLQVITEESAMAEGIQPGRLFGFGRLGEQSHREGFFNKWIDINEYENFIDNPWVWVVRFSLNKERSRL